MNKDMWEYHSGDKSLMKEELTQITRPVKYLVELGFAIRQLEKYGTTSVVKSRKAKDELGRMKDEYALFRKKIERMV